MIKVARPGPTSAMRRKKIRKASAEHTSPSTTIETTASLERLLGTGTLSASDGAGHTYDGSQGFFLTLDVNAMATFNYQAPNVGGTYQVLRRT